MLVVYGSQTGTAGGIAEKLARDATRRHVPVRLFALDEFPLASLVDEQFVVFVVATTGQGEEPDNMKRFWRAMLRKSLPPTVFAGVKVAVFGLGDSSYTKFNFVAKKLYKRLQQLGAQLVAPLALGDEQHALGIDGALDPWCSLLWPHVLLSFPPPPGSTPIPDSVPLPAPFLVAPCPAEASSVELPAVLSDVYAFSEHAPGLATVHSNTRLTAAGHFQDVRHLDLALPGVFATSYQPGDVLHVQPCNAPEEVEAALDWLALPGDDLFSALPRDPAHALPAALRGPLTLRGLLTSFFDLHGVPRRKFFEILSFYSEHGHEREKLRSFNSAEGQEDLYAYANRPRRTLLEALFDFPGTRGRIPLEALFDLLPRLQPRAYSIASAAAAGIAPAATHVQLTVAVVAYRTRMATPRQGLCSSWLVLLSPGALMRVWIRRGVFRLPADLATPVVMVGPGTGVAPFRAFIQDRVAHGANDNTLVFGNRNAASDCLYGDEWAGLQAAGQLTVFTAFSRDQEDKIYVQHRLRDPSVAAFLWEKIRGRGAFVYVAGNSKRMPQDVRAAFVHMAESQGQLSGAEAEAFVLEMERSGRYQTETWA